MAANPDPVSSSSRSGGQSPSSPPTHVCRAPVTHASTEWTHVTDARATEVSRHWSDTQFWDGGIQRFEGSELRLAGMC